MRIPLEVFVENFERLRSERRTTLAFLGRFAADEVCQVLHSVLVSLLSLRHPSLQHRLDLLCRLRRYIQLLKPAPNTVKVSRCYNLIRSAVCAVYYYLPGYWKPTFSRSTTDWTQRGDTPRTKDDGSSSYKRPRSSPGLARDDYDDDQYLFHGCIHTAYL